MADIIELGLKARTIGVDQSAAELDRLTAASDRAEKGAKGMEAASTKAAPAVRRVGQEGDTAAPKVRKLGTEADRTGREMREMGSDADSASRKVTASGKAAEAAGRSSVLAGHGARSFAMQLSQVAQQSSATGQPLQALAIQLPDMALGFGTVGIAAGIAAGALLPLVANMAGGEAKSLADEVDELGESLTGYAGLVDQAMTSTEELTRRFGLAARGAREVFVALALNKRKGLEEEVSGAISGSADPFGLDSTLSGLQPGVIADYFGLDRSFLAIGRSARDARDAIDAVTEPVQRAANAMDAAADADVDAQIAAVESMLSAYSAAADASGERTAEERDYIDALGAVILKLQEMKELDEQIASIDQMDRDRVLDEYAGRINAINLLLADRALAEEAASLAAAEGNEAAEERARSAIDAIDEQIKATTDADGRLDGMRDTLEALDLVMASIDFDGEGEMREQVEKVRKELKEAGWNADNLGEADLTALEAALRSIAGFAERAAEATGETVESLKEADSLADTYSRYYQGRLASDRIGDAGRPGQITDAAELLRQFEGFIPTPKWDVNALRVGYGSDTITLSDGTIRKVTEGVKVSVADANRDLERRIGEFQEGIIREVGVGRWSTFSEGQQAVLTSIAYNYGSIGASGAGIADEVRSGDTLAIVAAIEGLASHNGGINSNRRMTEAQIFAGDTKIDGAGAVLERLDKEQERLAERAATEGERAFDQYRALVSSMDEATAAQIRFEDAQETINEALAAGKITADEAAAARSSASARLAEDLAEAEENSHAARDAYEALVSSLDPVTAATLRFAEAQEQINAALAAGEISAEEAARTTDLARQEMEESIAAANQLADASRTGGEYLGNMMNGLLDGSMNAKEALGSLLMELAKVQMMKATLGLAGGGGFIGSAIGALGSALTVPSFDGGGYTGDGPRSGGLDGKGGYPAIVHPGEVIQDLTKGQGGGYGGSMKVDVGVSVDDDGNLKAYVKRIGRDEIRQAAPGIRNSAVDETARVMRTQPKGRFGL